MEAMGPAQPPVFSFHTGWRIETPGGGMTLEAGGLGNGYYRDGNVAYLTCTHTPRIMGSNPGWLAMEPSLLPVFVREVVMHCIPKCKVYG